MRLSPKKKFDKSREANICTNCLKPGHFYKQCTQGSCKKCNSKHHSLLHPEKANRGSQGNENVNNNFLMQHTANNTSENHSPTSLNSETENTGHLTFSNFNSVNQVILSTVLVNILDKNNKIHLARALLDCGSQSSFISNDLGEKIDIVKTKVHLAVNGINHTSSVINHKCIISIQSNYT